MVEKAAPLRILITGATGFVGNHLAERCRTHYPQAKLFGLYHRSRSPAKLPVVVSMTALQADITQANEVSEALKLAQPDLIFHLAAQSSVAMSWSDPVQTLQINALGTLHLLEAVRLQQLATQIVLIGSGEEYGSVPPHDNPIHEDYRLRPSNPYAVSKATQGLYGYQYFVAHRLATMRARAFNHFGPGQADTFVVSSFARQIALIEAGKAEALMHVGNLQAERDFLAVEDVARAYIAIAGRGHPGEVYNVGSGKARPIRTILDHFLSCAHVKIQVYEDPARMRPTDTPILEADISRIKAHTGWEPVVPFESALKATLDYWRGQVAKS